MSFGLINALSIFQVTMNRIFETLLRKFVMVNFFNDILVYNLDEVTHRHHLAEVLMILRKK